MSGVRLQPASLRPARSLQRVQPRSTAALRVRLRRREPEKAAGRGPQLERVVGEAGLTGEDVAKETTAKRVSVLTTLSAGRCLKLRLSRETARILASPR